jgi:hypothetical protein
MSLQAFRPMKTFNIEAGIQVSRHKRQQTPDHAAIAVVRYWRHSGRSPCAAFRSVAEHLEEELPQPLVGGVPVIFGMPENFD